EAGQIHALEERDDAPLGSKGWNMIYVSEIESGIKKMSPEKSMFQTAPVPHRAISYCGITRQPGWPIIAPHHAAKSTISASPNSSSYLMTATSSSPVTTRARVYRDRPITWSAKPMLGLPW